MAKKLTNYLTSTDVARICCVDLKTVHNWLDRDDASMPHFKTSGGHLRFKPREIVPWLEARGYDVPKDLKARAETDQDANSGIGGASVGVDGSAPYRVEIEQEKDGSWTARVPAVPDSHTRAYSSDLAVKKCVELSLRLMADQLERNELSVGSLGPLFSVPRVLAAPSVAA